MLCVPSHTHPCGQWQAVLPLLWTILPAPWTVWTLPPAHGRCGPFPQPKDGVGPSPSPWTVWSSCTCSQRCYSRCTVENMVNSKNGAQGGAWTSWTLEPPLGSGLLLWWGWLGDWKVQSQRGFLLLHSQVVSGQKLGAASHLSLPHGCSGPRRLARRSV